MKLLKTIQEKLKVPKTNQAKNYKYRNAEDILMAVKPILSGYGEAATLILSDDLVQIGERYYVVATAYLSDGEKILKAKAFAREMLDKKNKSGQDIIDPMQLTLASSSYARKQALNGLFCLDDSRPPIDDTKDTPKPLSEITLTEKQLSGLMELSDEWYAANKEEWDKKTTVPASAGAITRAIYQKMGKLPSDQDLTDKLPKIQEYVLKFTVDEVFAASDWEDNVDNDMKEGK